MTAAKRSGKMEAQRNTATKQKGSSPQLSIPAKDLFVQHLDLIARVARMAATRKRMRREDAEDFTSWVFVRLMENDYEIIRKFQGRSSFWTYASSVVANLSCDYMNHQHRRWRSSEAAKRLGPTAVRLEKLLYRNGLALHEAIQILMVNYGVPLSESDLEALYSKLPRRPSRISPPLEGGTDRRSTADAVEERELDQLARRVELSLAEVIDQLPPHERQVLEMRFRDGWPIVEIAAALDIDVRRLYRIIRRLMARFRSKLLKDDLGNVRNEPEVARRLTGIFDNRPSSEAESHHLSAVGAEPDPPIRAGRIDSKVKRSRAA